MAQLFFFLKQKKVFLKRSKLTASVNKVESREKFWDEAVVFAEAVVIADVLIVVNDAGKRKLLAVKGREFTTEILFPSFPSLVLADKSLEMKLGQIFWSDIQGHGNFYILILFVKIFFRYWIVPQSSPDGFEDTCFTSIIFAYEN